MDLEPEQEDAPDEISWWWEIPLQDNNQLFMCQPCVTTSIMLYTTILEWFSPNGSISRKSGHEGFDSEWAFKQRIFGKMGNIF